MADPIVSYFLNLDPKSRRALCDLYFWGTAEEAKQQARLEQQQEAKAKATTTGDRCHDGWVSIPSRTRDHATRIPPQPLPHKTSGAGRAASSSSVASSSVASRHKTPAPPKQQAPETLALPTALLAKIMESLFESGSDQQHALACAMARALDAETAKADKASSKKKQKEAEQAERERRGLPRRNSFSHRATASMLGLSTSTSTARKSSITAAPSNPKPSNRTPRTNPQSDATSIRGLSSPSSMSHSSSAGDPLTSETSGWESSGYESGSDHPASARTRSGSSNLTTAAAAALATRTRSPAVARTRGTNSSSTTTVATLGASSMPTPLPARVRPTPPPSATTNPLALSLRPPSTLTLRPATSTTVSTALWQTFSTARTAVRRQWQSRRGGGRRARRRGTDVWEEDQMWAEGLDMPGVLLGHEIVLAPGSAPKEIECKVVGHSMARDVRGNTYVQYRLRVSQGGRWKDVDKRYSEIADFAASLSYLHDKDLSQLVPKKPWLSFGSAVDPKVTEERTQVIGAYLDAVMARANLRASAEVQAFLEFALHSVTLAEEEEEVEEEVEEEEEVVEI